MTARVSLTYAGFNYLDRTLAMQLGEVVPEGVDVRYVTIREIGALFRRMAQHAEFEASEMSLSTLTMMASRRDQRLIGIPVFPSRSFRHGFLFINRASGVREVADLRGKRIGVQDYQATAYLWIRAVLEHDYGVAPSELEWHVGGLDIGSPSERLRHAPPPGVRISAVPSGRTVEGMLLDGELDAVFTPERLLSLRSHPDVVRRLLPDHADIERTYFARYGWFPIMHTVVIRRDVYDADPWLACALLDAFEVSKQIGLARLRRTTSPALALPWLEDAMEEIDERFGGDPFPYGFEANRSILEAMVGFSHEQGLSDAPLRPEDLFAPETWEHRPGASRA